jgi:hypothetical protein
VSESDRTEQAAALADEVRAALADGRLAAGDVRALLDRAVEPERGRRLSTFVVAAGVLIAYAGLALLYATSFGDLSRALRIVTPFAFPLVSLGAAVTIARRRPEAWLAEVALGVGYASLACAVVASTSVVADRQDLYLTLAALACAALAGVLLWLLPLRVLSYWAFGSSLGVAVIAGAWTLGVQDSAVRWSLLAVGAVAAGAGYVLVREGRRRAAGAASALGVFALAAAATVGGSLGGKGMHVSAWHALLTVTIMAAILLGAFAGLPELTAAGALGGLEWLMLAVGIVANEPAWALAVIAFGLALAAGTVLVVRMRDHRPAAHG